MVPSFDPKFRCSRREIPGGRGLPKIPAVRTTPETRVPAPRRPESMKKFHVATLGCKINQYESQALAESWAREHERVDAPEAADLILVNSCAVTANAVADLRQLVRKLHRSNPAAEIVVTGCAAQVMAEELAELPGVTRVVAQADKAELLEPLRPLAVSTAGEATEERNGNDPVAGRFPGFAISDYHRARAVVKIQDGCSHHCTYCIVPLTRGPSVSRPMGEVLAEARRLLDGGFRELILSGVNLRHFGRDLPGRPDFWDLVSRLEGEFADEWKGRARLRISSVEPGQLTDKALDVLAASSLVCPQLHLSLQSGDPKVLRRMGRGHYRPEQALEFARRLEGVWPVFGLGADIIAGFPGETAEQFERTLEFCENLPLSYAHVFPYSVRPGTRAASMSDQVDGAERKARAARLRKAVAVKKRKFLAHLLELPRLDVLVQDAGTGVGVSEYYAACRLESGAAGSRELVRCRPLRVERGVVVVGPGASPSTNA